MMHEQHFLAYSGSFPTGDDPKHHRVISIATNTSTVLSAPVTYPITTAGVGMPDVV